MNIFNKEKITYIMNYCNIVMSILTLQKIYLNQTIIYQIISFFINNISKINVSILNRFKIKFNLQIQNYLEIYFSIN